MNDVRVLLVDDDEIVRTTLSRVLEQHGFVVTTASNVSQALKLITASETYDVLLSDLHMPGAGDGLTVVSAMRHAHPHAVTLLLSAFPEMTAALQAILRQTDEILMKPMDLLALIKTINERVAKGAQPQREIKSVATILESESQATILEWFERIQTEKTLMSIPMSFEERCGHLPTLFRELVARLRAPYPIGTKELTSVSALDHGAHRFDQGYTAAMLVEESRMLQVSIFNTLQNNLASIDYNVLLIGVMTIADEIDSQLSQAVTSYTRQMELAV